MTENTFLNYYLGRFFNVLNTFSAEKYIEEYKNLNNLDNIDDVYFYTSIGNIFIPIKKGEEENHLKQLLDRVQNHLFSRLSREFGLCRLNNKIPLLNSRMIISAIPHFNYEDFVNFEDSEKETIINTHKNIYNGYITINDNNFEYRHSEGVLHIDIPIIKNDDFLFNFVESNEFSYVIHFVQHVCSVIINNIEYMPINAEFYYNDNSLLVSPDEMYEKSHYKGKKGIWYEEEAIAEWFKNHKKLRFKDSWEGKLFLRVYFYDFYDYNIQFKKSIINRFRKNIDKLIEYKNGIFLFDKKNPKKIIDFTARKNEKLLIPEGAMIIGEKAFQCWSNLKYVENPDSLEEIGYKAFAFCWSLASINIPANIKVLGPSVFYRCEALKEIKFLSQNPNEIKISRTFLHRANIEQCTLWCPSGSEDLYKKHKVLGIFKIIKGFE